MQRTAYDRTDARRLRAAGNQQATEQLRQADERARELGILRAEEGRSDQPSRTDLEGSTSKSVSTSRAADAPVSFVQAAAPAAAGSSRQHRFQRGPRRGGPDAEVAWVARCDLAKSYAEEVDDKGASRAGVPPRMGVACVNRREPSERRCRPATKSPQARARAPSRGPLAPPRSAYTPGGRVAGALRRKQVAPTAAGAAYEHRAERPDSCRKHESKVADDRVVAGPCSAVERVGCDGGSREQDDASDHA
jgi:hypothetical protein